MLWLCNYTGSVVADWLVSITAVLTFVTATHQLLEHSVLLMASAGSPENFFPTLILFTESLVYSDSIH